MIYFTHFPKRVVHTDRTYLTQWFYTDILVITDVDINEEKNLETLINNHPCKNVIVDLSHNAMTESDIPEFLKKYLCLSTMFTDWYNSNNQVHYFPLWLWMFNCRSNQFFQSVSFDAGGAKTLPLMCLNRNLHPHRVKFVELIQPILNRIVYSYGTKTLLNDEINAHDQLAKIDIGVGAPAYSQCAVNVVTETVMDRPSLSEKSCKPFAARQIPIILGPANSSQFLSDIGLDMFDDLVPWKTWDSESDEDQRIQKVAEFVTDWVNRGTILEDYKNVIPRIERNKQYLHSEQFRNLILSKMPCYDPFTP